MEGDTGKWTKGWTYMGRSHSALKTNEEEAAGKAPPSEPDLTENSVKLFLIIASFETGTL